MPDYKVEAELAIKAGQSAKVLDGIQDRLTRLQRSIQGSESLANNLVTRLAVFGAGYKAVTAVSSAFSFLVREGMAFNSQLETARIGLATVVSAVEGISLDAATNRANESFKHLQQAAVRGVGELTDYVQVFQTIVGPVRTVGRSMEQIEGLTTNAVTASAALGIDIAQTSRDMNAMVRGAAGLDVKLFSSLRSMGLISEDAKDFNQLTQVQRVAEIERALSGFAQAADRYAHSWPGILSTFSDVRKQLTSSFLGPILDKFKTFFDKVNELLIGRMENLQNGLGNIGDTIASVIGPGLDRALNGIKYVVEHWDELSDRMARTIDKVREMAPKLLEAAKTFAAVSLGRQALGAGVGAVNAGVGLYGALGGGAAAAGAGGTAAAGAAGGAKGAAAVAAAAQSTAAFSGAALALGAALVIAAPLVAFISDRWQELAATFEWLSPLFRGLWEDLSAVGSNLGEFLMPMLKLLGGVLVMGFVGALSGLAAILRVITVVVRLATDVLAWFGRGLDEYVVKPLLDFFTDLLQHVARFLGLQFGDGKPAHSYHQNGEALGREGARMLAQRESQSAEAQSAYESSHGLSAWNGAASATPHGRASNHYDFRGSKIEVKQDFKEADPDRVAYSMIEDMARFAEQQVGSRFASPLTR